MPSIVFGSVVVLYNDDYLCQLDNGKYCIVYFDKNNMNTMTGSDRSELLDRYNNYIIAKLKEVEA